MIARLACIAAALVLLSCVAISTSTSTLHVKPSGGHTLSVSGIGVSDYAIASEELCAAALRLSAAHDLACPFPSVEVKSARGTLVADGCGERAVYVCAFRSLQAGADGDYESGCEMVLVNRFPM
ncbi:MAG TPA: hypothetical protein VGG39_10575 [Polyangiaceae bacterium]|jgi:hypothetical protein